MSVYGSIRISLGIFIAGAVLFVSQVFFQEALAVAYGTNAGLIAISIVISLLGASFGAQFPKIPPYSAPLLLAALFLSPLPSRIILSPDLWEVCSFAFVGAMLSGNWITRLLSSQATARLSILVAMEWIGGIFGIALLLTILMPQFSLIEIAHTLGFACLVGAGLSWGSAKIVEQVNVSPQIPFALLLLSAWSGFQFFFSQTAWTHLLAQIHSNSHTAFAMAMLAMLVGMPFAAYFAGRIKRIETVAIIAIMGSLVFPVEYLFLSPYLSTPFAQVEFPWAIFLFSILLLAPVAACSAILFPYLLRNHGQVRALFTANLLGGLAGAFGAGFVSLPWLGLPLSLSIPSMGWLLLFLYSSRSQMRIPMSLAGILAIALGIFLWIQQPGQAPLPYRVLERGESWEGRLELVERNSFLYLLINGQYALGGSRSLDAERRQSQLAMELRPQAQSAFVLGLGTGITAGELVNHKTLAKIRVVELSPLVVDFAHRHFSPWTNGLFDDARVQVEDGDARIALQHDPSQYDVILGDLFLPWLPGAELLMGVEHFKRVESHLSTQGVFVQWLPLFQLSEPMFLDILATALTVFDNVYLFKGDEGTAEPMIALVAPANGSSLYVSGAQPELLEHYAGNARDLEPLLRGTTAWNQDNRIVRVIQTGALYAGQPSPAVAMTGERYLNWIAKAFQAKPPERDPGVIAFGPEAWRYAAKGFFLQQASFYRDRGDMQGAAIMAQRAVQYGPRP